MVLEQNPLLAATESGEDSMIGVCEVRSFDHKAEEARKGQTRPRVKSVHLNTFQAADVTKETNRTHTRTESGVAHSARSSGCYVTMI